MKVLFLDVDGVLNRCGHSNQGLEDEKMSLLRWIVEKTGCEIVVSSTWRKFQDHKIRLLRALDKIGAEVAGLTPVLDSRTSGAWGESIWIAPSRGDEISAWLAKHPVEKFVILDDDDDVGKLRPHLVLTDSFNGLTPEIASEVINRFAPSPSPVP